MKICMVYREDVWNQRMECSLSVCVFIFHNSEWYCYPSIPFTYTWAHILQGAQTIKFLHFIITSTCVLCTIIIVRAHWQYLQLLRRAYVVSSRRNIFNISFEIFAVIIIINLLAKLNLRTLHIKRCYSDTLSLIIVYSGAECFSSVLERFGVYVPARNMLNYTMFSCSSPHWPTAIYASANAVCKLTDIFNSHVIVNNLNGLNFLCFVLVSSSCLFYFCCLYWYCLCNWPLAVELSK